MANSPTPKWAPKTLLTHSQLSTIVFPEIIPKIPDRPKNTHCNRPKIVYLRLLNRQKRELRLPAAPSRPNPPCPPTAWLNAWASELCRRVLGARAGLLWWKGKSKGTPPRKGKKYHIFGGKTQFEGLGGPHLSHNQNLVLNALPCKTHFRGGSYLETNPSLEQAVAQFQSNASKSQLS